MSRRSAYECRDEVATAAGSASSVQAVEQDKEPRHRMHGRVHHGVETTSDVGQEVLDRLFDAGQRLPRLHDLVGAAADELLHDLGRERPFRDRRVPRKRRERTGPRCRT